MGTLGTSAPWYPGYIMGSRCLYFNIQYVDSLLNKLTFRKNAKKTNAAGQIFLRKTNSASQMTLRYARYVSNYWVESFIP
jgi:hypothetical protein